MNALHTYVNDLFITHEENDRMNARWLFANVFLGLIVYSFVKLGKPTLTPMQWANLLLLFISFNMFIFEAKE